MTETIPKLFIFTYVMVERAKNTTALRMREAQMI